MNNNKSLFKFFITLFVLVTSLKLHANVMVDQDYTDDFQESDKFYYCNWDSIPKDCVQMILSGTDGINPVIECYDKKGEKYYLSLLSEYKPVPNGGIDMYRPMILHLMVGEEELPVKWYEFGYRNFAGCGVRIYYSNRKELSMKVKGFLKSLFSQRDGFYIKLCPSSAPTHINKIGPLVE